MVVDFGTVSGHWQLARRTLPVSYLQPVVDEWKIADSDNASSAMIQRGK
jgi:hypothetical protein